MHRPSFTGVVHGEKAALVEEVVLLTQVTVSTERVVLLMRPELLCRGCFTDQHLLLEDPQAVLLLVYWNKTAVGGLGGVLVDPVGFKNVLSEHVHGLGDHAKEAGGGGR